MSHSHHHHHEGCCHQDHDSCCSNEHEHESCCHAHGDDCHKDFAQQLLSIADEAWMDLLKEKIKNHIQSNSDQHLEEIAGIVAESNKERWQHKMAIQKTKEDFKNKLDKAFGCKSCSCK